MNTSIKIISDGSSRNTKVLNHKGEEIQGITNIDFSICADSLAVATLKFIDVECELVASWEFNPLKQWANKKIGVI